jgi:hypothetical protein
MNDFFAITTVLFVIQAPLMLLTRYFKHYNGNSWREFLKSAIFDMVILYAGILLMGFLAFLCSLTYN